MTEFVRVKLENGADATVSAGFAKSHGLEPLDKPATGRDGKALRDKPRVSVAKRAAAKPSKTTATKAGSTTTNPSGSDVTAGNQEVSK